MLAQDPFSAGGAGTIATFCFSVARKNLTVDNVGSSGRGHSAVALVESGLFVFYALAAMGLSTLASRWLLASIIASINSAHIYIVS